MAAAKSMAHTRHSRVRAIAGDAAFALAGAIAPAAPDFKPIGPDFEAAGPDFGAAGPNLSVVFMVSKSRYRKKIETARRDLKV